MAFEGTPWFVGGGAEHSPEVARVVAYAAMNGSEGVITPDALKVTALPVPGGAVRIAPGPLGIRSRATGGEHQMYVGREIAAEDVDISPTGSGGGRTDMMIARIEDPNVPGSGYSQPANPEAGPYIFARVLPNVPPTATTPQEVPGHANSTAIALARVTLPASTGTVTSGMITDLRRLANPRSQTRQFSARNALAPGAGEKNPLTASDWTRWPDVATWAIEVPPWATHAILRASVESYIVKTGLTTGRLAPRLGFGAGQQIGAHVSFDENGSANPYRNSLGMGAEFAIPAAQRGKSSQVDIIGLRSEAAGSINADSFTTALMTVTFEERIA